MNMEFNFEKLKVYQEAIDFADRVYGVVKSFPKEELFGITSQLRRAAISVPSNIAEGSSRSKREFRRFLNIALGSAYECMPLLELSKRQSYLDQQTFSQLKAELHKISAKLNALKNSLKENSM